MDSQHKGDLTVKGSADVRLYWERGGQAHRFLPGTPLVNGDRVLAEVLVPRAASAYWGVVNGSGELLGPPSTVLASRMDLSPGKRQTFSSSLQLVGAPEGERLVVLVCPPDVTPEQASFVRLEGPASSACTIWRFQLR